jgi:4-hydroxythreonine-4-phosphate dehydrogenase
LLIGLSQGDPAGIGPEIIMKMLAAGEDLGATPVVFGSRLVFQNADRWGAASRLKEIDLARPRLEPGEIGLIEVPLDKLPPIGENSAEAGLHAFAVLEKAALELKNNHLSALVTAPLSKEAIQKSLPGFIGHTEYLAEIAGNPFFGMLLSVDPLRVLHVTTHQSLRSACEAICEQNVLDTIRLMKKSLDYLGVEAGKIAVCALNPHAGEGGAFGREEIESIAPAIRAACKEGIEAIGPLPPDTVFYRALRGEFAGIVAMYHDQGHIPLKMLGLDRGINVTVGLPFIRTSVDHGTAFDLAGQGTADEGSLLAAWRLAVDLANRQAFEVFA